MVIVITYLIVLAGGFDLSSHGKFRTTFLRCQKIQAKFFQVAARA
jgi:hypothetical protein